MKRFSLSILINFVSIICVFAHDMSRDVFSYNSKDSTCTLIYTYGTEPTKTSPSRPIARSYGEYINGYRFIAVGDGTSTLPGTLSIDLPLSIQYVNDYSLGNVVYVSIPEENELKYIGAYGLPGNPFIRCNIYINKDCYIHPYAFASIPFNPNNYSHTLPTQLHGNTIKIDSLNPYWGLEDGMLYQKDSVNVVRYFVHEEYGDTILIPKLFTHVNQISTCGSRTNENICFEDVSTLKKLYVKYCNITNEDEVWNMNNMDTVYFELSECYLKVKELIFPNAKYISNLKIGVQNYNHNVNHITLKNVEEIANSNGYLFTETVDTVSVYTTLFIGNKLFAKANIKRLNWLNEDVPFSESMEEYAERIDVLNLGSAKAVGIKGLMYSLKARNRESSILLSTSTPPEVLSMVLFDDYPSKVKLYVPIGSGDTYRNHEKWGIIP
ncbi:MAG: hypothetical protein IJ328_04220, partial [Muribaculaceae bacterium]|nr:hypothetical protein [Muribaculaceae bacterium]